jgi:hypothetical protein
VSFVPLTASSYTEKRECGVHIVLRDVYIKENGKNKSLKGGRR